MLDSLARIVVATGMIFLLCWGLGVHPDFPHLLAIAATTYGAACGVVARAKV